MTKTKNKKLWLAALKPPMYTVAIMPIIVGSAIAFYQTEQFKSLIFWLFLSSAVFILAWLNLSNDVFDSETGIDVRKAESIVNITGKKSLIFIISNLILILGIIQILAIAWLQNDSTVLLIVLLCCALGYSYQGPPFRLGYQGMGEIICFITFGPLAIVAAYYSQTMHYSYVSLATSIIVGINTSLILLCSHFHQVEDDLAAGKLSPIVRIGTAKGAQIVTIFSLAIYILPLIYTLIGVMPSTCLLILASFPIAYQLITHMLANHSEPKLIRNSKYIAVKLHFFSNLLLAIGFILASG
jgi:1,4-dihydroxy-2-naphthoate octaprenyltransferase